MTSMSCPVFLLGRDMLRHCIGVREAVPSATPPVGAQLKEAIDVNREAGQGRQRQEAERPPRRYLLTAAAVVILARNISCYCSPRDHGHLELLAEVGSHGQQLWRPTSLADKKDLLSLQACSSIPAHTSSTKQWFIFFAATPCFCSPAAASLHTQAEPNHDLIPVSPPQDALFLVG